MWRQNPHPLQGKVRNDTEGGGSQKKALGSIRRKQGKRCILPETFEPSWQMWRHKMEFFFFQNDIFTIFGTVTCSDHLTCTKQGNCVLLRGSTILAGLVKLCGCSGEGWNSLSSGAGNKIWSSVTRELFHEIVCSLHVPYKFADHCTFTRNYLSDYTNFYRL